MKLNRLVVTLATTAAFGAMAVPAHAAKPAAGGTTCKRGTSCTDTTAPSVLFSSPSAGATLAGTVTLTGSASDNVSVAKVETSVDGATWSVASGTTSWSSSVSTASYADGTHTLYARATDTSGNVATTSVSVTFSNTDTTAPSVAIAAPSSGATVSGTVPVTGSASDNAAVARIDVQVDGGSWQQASGTASWSWSWATSGLANGGHTLTARATDTAGNVKATSTSVTVSNTTPDTTPPAVAVSSPAGGTTVAGSVTVSGTASDNTSLARVEVQVDGGSWQQASGTASWSWSWATGSVPNGTHTLTARATDTSGNTSTSSVSVSVSNTTSLAPSTQGSWTSPEGVQINVDSAGPWTIAQVYDLLTANALDLGRVGPHLTVNVQDTYTSQTVVSACCSGAYTSIVETMWLQGVGSSFSQRPDDTLAHEYGHAWSWFWNYTGHNADWTAYKTARWTTSDGSLNLATDSRTNSSYSWQVVEVVGDDYRLLFGSASAISERPTHLNTAIPDPRNVPGLKDFLYTQWRTA